MCCDVRCSLSAVRNVKCKYLKGDLDYINLGLTCDSSSMARCPMLISQSPWYAREVIIRDLKNAATYRFVFNRLITSQSEDFKGTYTQTTPCLKNKQNYFCYNYVKLSPNLTIFGTMMANCLKLYEVHSFSTSPNSRQCTTV